MTCRHFKADVGSLGFEIGCLLGFHLDDAERQIFF
jgi:hypothetical protein